MYSEKTEIIDVVKVVTGTGDDAVTTYTLNKKAGDLYESALSGDVIRRHDISTTAGVVHNSYIGLSEVKKDSNGFKFVFANGDVFAASTADAYPSASAVSDILGVNPLVFYTGTLDGDQLKKGSASGSNTTEDDWDEIIVALSTGRPVIVMSQTGVNSVYLPHVAVGAAQGLDLSNGTVCKVEVVGYGSNLKGVQLKVVCTIAAS